MLNLALPFLGNVASGALSYWGTQQANSANRKATHATNMMNYQMNTESAAESARQFNINHMFAQSQFNEQARQAQLDRDMQREFAQNGVQWRVADAQKAGLHPLAALGMQGASSSPISISGDVPGGSVPNNIPMQAPPPQQNALQGMGQDLSRAMSAVANAWERDQSVKQAQQLQSLENQSLQNKLLATQIAKTTGASVGPPMPMSGGKNAVEGQGNTKLIKWEPAEVTRVDPTTKHMESGVNPEVRYFNSPFGTVMGPADKFKESIEDSFLDELAHNIRTRVPAMLGSKAYAPKEAPGPGKEWSFNPLTQTWNAIHPIYKDGKFQPGEWWNSRWK